MGLTAHLAFQVPGWHWPLLRAPDLVWPVGRSIAMSDSNPLMSLAAKLLSGAAGHPINLLGVWLGLCWVLQPVGSVYALRSMLAYHRSETPTLTPALAAACFGLLCPAWLMRQHINLLGHFFLLAALGLSIRMIRGSSRQRWSPVCVLLTLCVLVHPYVFVFAAIMMCAPICRALLEERALPWRMLGAYAATCCLPVALLWVLSGSLGASAPGYGYFSMNLLSPFWPQISGVFGPALPVIDATGGQYEGFNYLGAGSLIIAACGAWLLYARPIRCADRRRSALAILFPLGALTMLALTPRVYAGHLLLVPLPEQPWRKIFAAIQASGRAFWLVGYAVTFCAIAILSARLRIAVLRPVLAAAIILQALDAAPLMGKARDFLAGLHQAPPPFVMPNGATLLQTVPACDHVSAPADLLRLDAVRHGMRLADMRMARQAPGYDCETALSDGLEAPLANGEIRVFLPAAQGAFRADALGPDVTCTRLVTNILCSRLAWVQPGQKLIEGVPIPEFALSGQSSLPAPAAILSFGWKQDGVLVWSEGPRATLLFRRAPTSNGPVALVMILDGIADAQGGSRRVSIRCNGAEPLILSLADQRRTRVVLPMTSPAPGLPDRIIFDMRRPIDPAKRGLNSPVRRAAIRLYGLSLNRDSSERTVSTDSAATVTK